MEGEPIPLVAPFIAGSTVYSARQLSDVFSAQIGTPVTARSLASMVDAIESRYRADGFVAPVVTIDDAAEQSTTPRLFIHEAAVTQVRLRGEAGPNQEQLLQYIEALKTLRPIRKDQARRILASIQRLPGVSVRAAFEPTAVGVNEFTLALEIRYRAVSADLSVANRGSHASGRELLGGRATLNGLLGQQEFLTLEGATSTSFDQYHYSGLSLARAFSSTWLSLSVSNAHARPWAASDRYDRNRYALQVLTPGWVGERSRINVLTRFIAIDSALSNDDYGPLSREQLRKVEAGLSWGSNANAASSLSGLIIHGVNAFGAGTRSYDDWSPADPVFTKLVLNGERAVSLGDRLRLTGEFAGELAFDTLPAAESFIFGGSRFGRGLEAADLVGQSGVALSLDIERASSWKSIWMDSATMYAGLDYGYAWSTNTGVRRDHAASTRAGMTLDWGRFTSSFELSYPLHRPHYTETANGVAAFLELQWSL
jgi:hemolysin activation/secretion protein